MGRHCSGPFDDTDEALLFAASSFTADAIDRARLVTGLSEVASESGWAAPVNKLLDEMLERLAGPLGFSKAAIHLVNDYRGVIEMVPGRNIDPEWQHLSRHCSNGPDITADIVRSCCTAARSSNSGREFTALSPAVYVAA